MRRTPIAIAHRGGVFLPENAGKENSLEAFANAVELGYEYIETDVRTTRDGEVFAFHDPDLRRTFGTAVQFADLLADDVRELRLAGGARIATLDELLTEFPDVVFNIDFKDGGGIERGLETISARRAQDRVVVASFSHKRLRAVREAAPHLLTSASQTEVAQMRVGRALRGATGPMALQIPERLLGLPILTDRLLRAAHEAGMQVHVWTIDDPQAMHDLLNRGVDGIITDRPDVLKDVLISRGEWKVP